MNYNFARRLLITLIPAVSVLAIIAAVRMAYHVRIPDMTRDMAMIAKIHPLAGVLSNLGILLWCAAASICLFSALAVRNAKPKEIFWFLLSSALLSMYLLFDDFFMFHEALATRYLGIDEKVVIRVLGVAVFVYLIVFGRVILRTNYVMFLLALGLLAGSVAVDTILERWMLQFNKNWLFFIEDGSKWLGIACWCSYYVQTSFRLVVGSRALSGIATESDALTRGVYGYAGGLRPQPADVLAAVDNAASERRIR